MRMAATKQARVLALAASCDAKAAASQPHLDLWTNIFEFVPHGRYLQISSVSTGWRALYASSMQQRGRAHSHKKTNGQAMLASVPLVQWAVANGCRMTLWLLWQATIHGTFEVVQYVHANGAQINGDVYYSWIACNAAAARGDLELLQWMRAHGFHYSALTIATAAGSGHLEVLEWARRDTGCAWDEQTCKRAAAGGHLDILQYARGHGCPWDSFTTYMAVCGGHLQLLQWAHANGCPLDNDIYSAAVYRGHIHVLQWLQDIGHPWGQNLCKVAIQAGRLAVLQWLRARGCPWDGERVFCFLEWTDHRNEDSHFRMLSAVEWALAHGCPCSDSCRARYEQLRRMAQASQA
eukprot:TRINITY_DN462_c1_g2_i3.p1 TRINITY_DN462_c1_g2~~TRINITY_DN462_c1_g2_i3.p1  ORF type:complete len:350 (-),score=29.94 TRINITY_DN462_c1_g2_i3:113-1162(-)